MTFTAAFGGLVGEASVEILRASLSDALRMTGWMTGLCDCRGLAVKKDVPLQQVINEALRRYQGGQ
jgi:hypothetical protein